MSALFATKSAVFSSLSIHIRTQSHSIGITKRVFIIKDQLIGITTRLYSLTSVFTDSSYRLTNEIVMTIRVTVMTIKLISCLD